MELDFNGESQRINFYFKENSNQYLFNIDKNHKMERDKIIVFLYIKNIYLLLDIRFATIYTYIISLKKNQL